jgi:hypothetical protein
MSQADTPIVRGGWNTYITSAFPLPKGPSKEEDAIKEV